jgi:hypothetical protein
MEPTIEIQRAILAQQIASYANGMYLSKVAHKINKQLGNMEKCAEIEKDMIRLQREIDLWQAELDALK